MPTSSLLITLTVPPIFSMINLQILNPSPLPPGLIFLCSDKLPKFMNKLSILFSGIPQPKSCISKSNLMYSVLLASDYELKFSG